MPIRSIRTRNRPASVQAVGGVVGLLFSASLSGCTVLAFSLAALSDRAVGKGGPSHLLTTRRGVHVTLWLNDGRKMNGVFDDVLSRPIREVAAPAGLDSAVATSHGGAAQVAGLAGTDDSNPPFTEIVLIGDGGKRDTIAASSVTQVSVPHASGKVKGLIGGLLFDTLLAVWIGTLIGSQ